MRQRLIEAGVSLHTTLQCSLVHSGIRLHVCADGSRTPQPSTVMPPEPVGVSSVLFPDLDAADD